MAVTTQQVAEIYVATFNRAPDAAGLAYWVNDSFGGNASIEQIASSFFDSAEAQAIYTSTMTTTEKVTEAYANLFNRAPDADGLAYWVGQLDGGSISQSNMLIALVNGALNDDATIMNNKTTVGLAFADAGLDDVTQATSVMSGVTADAATVTAAQASIDAIVNTGSSFALTNSATADTVIGTALNDTITGATGTVANGDLIIDQSSTDNDTANLVVTAAYTPSNITKIENVNVDWDAYGTATYNFTGVTGADAITLTSSKLGYLGASTITAGASQHIVAGSGMIGGMTITGATTAITVDATNSSTVSVTGTGTATVNAGASTTSVVTSGFTTATVDAGTATSVTITDAAATTNATTVTTNANATLNTNGVAGALTVDIADAKTVTLSGASQIGASLAVTGTGDVTLVSTVLTAETLTNSKTSGTLTVSTSTTTDQNLANIHADTIKFTGTTNAVLTVASGANLEQTVASTKLDVTVAGTGTADTATVTFTGTAPTATALTLSGVETLNVVAAATAGTGTDFTVTALDLDTASNKAVVSGSNDISLGNITGTGQVDASAVTGTVALTQVAGGGALTLKGSATANNTATFTGTTVASTYTGGTGNDTVVFANTTGSGTASATALLSDGTNSVTANALTDGDLVVVAGSGNDTVSATAVTAASVNVQLGDGTNSLTIGTAAAGALAGATIVYQGGAGADTLTIADNVTATDSVTAVLGNGTNIVDIQGTSTGAATYNLTGGTGVDTLKVAAGTSLAASTLTLTAFDAIQIASAGTITFDVSDISGKTYEIKGNASASDLLAVTTTSTTGDTVDLSTLTMNQNVSTAASYTSITTGNGNDTITGTAVVDTVVAGNGTNVISTGAGADIITGGTGNDTVTAGTGADKITLNSGSDIVNQAKDDSSAIGAITAAGANLADADTIATTVDKVYNFTTGTDKLNLDGTFTSLTNLQAAAATATTLGLSDGQAGYVIGNYVVATGVFTVDSTPTIDGTESLMLLYDADATTGVTDIEAVVLVGITSIVIGDLS